MRVARRVIGSICPSCRNPLIEVYECECGWQKGIGGKRKFRTEETSTDKFMEMSARTRFKYLSDHENNMKDTD